MKINLTKEECYTDILSFYNIISNKLGLNIGKDVRYDSSKIYTTKAVEDEIIRYYKEVKCLPTIALIIPMVCYAPKSNLKPEEDYFVMVEDGFIIKKEGVNMDGD